jgi:tRNA(Ile)-lysidine synthase
MAMLLLAQAAIPRRFEVATVDHGLRAEAAQECAMVAQVCRERGIACAVLNVTVPSGNLQAEARNVRYAALAEWTARRGLTALATAHHADDQAETLVMRLNRGSGLSGLSGVRETYRLGALDQNLLVVRPLLLFRRHELQAVVDNAGMQVVQDSSNQDDSFDRARIRKALSEADWLDAAAWARSASHLGEAEEALEYLAERVWSENVSVAADGIRFRCCEWRAVQRRIADRAVRKLGGMPRGQDLDRLLRQLELGNGGNVAGVLVSCQRGGNDEVYWRFRPEPARRTSS